MSIAGKGRVYGFYQVSQNSQRAVCNIDKMARGMAGEEKLTCYFGKITLY